MEKPAIRFETERLIVRSVVEDDKEPYMALRIANSLVKAAYDIIPGFKDREWDEELNSTKDIYITARLRSNGDLAAIASFQDYESDCIELGLDVAECYRNQGIATELAGGMIKMWRILFPGKGVVLKTGRANRACRRVAEKCGGVLQGEEPTMAAKMIEALAKQMDDKCQGEVNDLISGENEHRLEQEKPGVCVYSFPGETGCR